MTDQSNNQKPADSPEANYDGQRTVVLPGGLPAIKEVEAKKPAVRQPMALTNAQDIAAIHNSHTASRNIESVLASLRQLLVHNLPYVPVVRNFIRELSAEIANPTEPDEGKS